MADDIGMHESTVSRVTTNKYVHTPQGIFELKYFFNSGISRTDGDDLASEAVKCKIKQIVASEDPKHPHSDQKIVELFKNRTSTLPGGPWQSTASSWGSCPHRSASKCSSRASAIHNVPLEAQSMQLATVTFRHMDASPAVKDYAEERLEKITKYFSRDPIAAHGTFSVERNHNHTAEVTLTLPNGIVIQARETTEDMYSSIDLSVARIERQVRKWKEKIRTHKPHGGPRLQVRQTVLAAENLEPQPGAAAEAKPSMGTSPSSATPPRRCAPCNCATQPCSSTSSSATCSFSWTPTRIRISVIYRRKDGNYGLIETGVSAPST